MDDCPENSELCNIMCWEFERKLDTQNRFAIPSEWRSGQDGEIYVLIPGRDHTLQMYTNKIFQERFMKNIKSHSPTQSDGARRMRLLGGKVCKCVCDKQGRIQIPPELLLHANLKDRIALIGSFDFVQIMDWKQWEDEKSSNSSDDFLDILG